MELALHTPASWVEVARSDILGLLDDHAHLERKAASNALELLQRWPDPGPPPAWIPMLTRIARDEVEHLAVVAKILTARGGVLSRRHRNLYAHGLREAVRLGDGPRELIDRLLVSALVEGRSHERFELLAAYLPDNELVALYAGLRASEAAHWRMFVELACALEARHVVETRWATLAAIEAEVLRAQPPQARMHGWVG